MRGLNLRSCFPPLCATGSRSCDFLLFNLPKPAGVLTQQQHLPAPKSTTDRSTITRRSTAMTLVPDRPCFRVCHSLTFPCTKTYCSPPLPLSDFCLEAGTLSLGTVTWRGKLRVIYYMSPVQKGHAWLLLLPTGYFTSGAST